jgi:hypothetical protein
MSKAPPRMITRRASAVLAALLLAAAVPTAQAPAHGQNSTEAANDDDEESGLKGCNSDSPCLDPMTLDSAPIEIAKYYLPLEAYDQKSQVIVVDPNQRQQQVIGGGFFVPERTAPWMAQIQRPSRLPRLT